MTICVRSPSRLLPANSRFGSKLKSLCAQKHNFSKALTLEMMNQSTSKRPMCPSCSKPARLCLCIRLKTPRLENSVSVTILQHSLEEKHALNSTRIVKLGLKNVTLATVSDVNFEAQVIVHLLKADSDVGCCKNFSASLDFDECIENSELVSGIELKSHIGGFSLQSGNTGNVRSLEIQGDLEYPAEVNDEMGDADAKCTKSDLEMVSDPSALYEAVSDNKTEVNHDNGPSQLGSDPIRAVPRGNEEPVFTVSVGKYGVISCLPNGWMPKDHRQRPDFGQILASPATVSALAKGFVVKKLQKRQLNGSAEFEEYEEFEIAVPPGSALLFPTEESIGVEDLDFDVKNLVVLDGTWAKAKRMYRENPWLKLLPHLKLDLNKISIYSEVRRQPKAGCLSTIESIVYALKALGDNPEGLDNLLDVFESMVGDQRRCKDERLSKDSIV